MEDFVEHYYVEPSKTDEEYEFDASRFFDFTRPEFESEIEEAERWFEVSGDYPPSPFIVKLNLEKLLSVEVVPSSSNRKYSNINKPSSNYSDIDSRHGASTPKMNNAKGGNNHVLQGTAKEKTKSSDKLYQPRSSTLMKPTASHLAKQNKIHDKHSNHLCTRFQKASVKIDGKGFQSHTVSDNLATKRQKLEIGYLKKIAQLKHRVSLSHKSSKKLTIPREPELETLLRAQRRSSKNSSVSRETEIQKQKECNSKARPLNRKILQAPPLPQPKKSKPQVPKTQVFHSKTLERANHRAYGKVYPSVTDTSAVRDVKQKGTTLIELSIVDKVLETPPIEQFSKLSLGSDNKANEDDPNSSQPEFRRCHAKPSQCGGHIRVHEAQCWSNMNRSSLGIR
ncbi:hypothetical protein BUALT_Bualt06G0123300 [Buddleja alternifolia]|uniref:TPX2 central domain-containing protein n=1 Tax=Buddleja alternifolia TaxID=168488 RepID=A0AAV6XLL5_9LAMI|nr:hypothetical protein BUALT_Bualt06G0123300 [Buddleja alternifolia]